jgi:serralysin
MTTSNSATAITHTVRTGPGTVQVDLTGQFDDNQSIIVQPDGKILVGGYTEHLAWGYPGAPGEEAHGYRQDHSIIRLNADGTLDTSFQDGGVDIVPAADDPSERYELSAVQLDGKVLIAIPDGTGIVVERYNSDGTLDATFGQNGSTTLEIEYDYSGIDFTASADGTFLISARGFDEATVIKVGKDGALVDGFGNKGVLNVKFPMDDYYRHLHCAAGRRGDRRRRRLQRHW